MPRLMQDVARRAQTLGIDDQNARFISGILPAVQSRNTRFPGCVQRVR